MPTRSFVSFHNAGRSQMAAGPASSRSTRHRFRRSLRQAAHPGDELNPAVVEAMAELGIDLGEEFPKPLTDEVVRAADVVITMGCGDACPIYPGKRYEDWVLDDPADQDAPRSAGSATRSTHGPRPSSRSSLPRPSLARRCLAEALATFVLVFAGWARSSPTPSATPVSARTASPSRSGSRSPR